MFWQVIALLVFLVIPLALLAQGLKRFLLLAGLVALVIWARDSKR